MGPDESLSQIAKEGNDRNDQEKKNYLRKSFKKCMGMNIAIAC